MAIISKELFTRAMDWLSHTIDRVNSTLVQEDIPRGFRSHVLVFRGTGIWPTADDSPSYKWLTIASITVLGIVYPLSQFVNILYANTIEEAMDHSFFPLACMADTFKAAVLYWRIGSIRNVFCIHEGLLGRIRSPSMHHDQIAFINFLSHIGFISIYSLSLCVFLIQFVLSSSGLWYSTSLWPYELAQQPEVYWAVLMFQMLCSWGLVLWGAMEDSFYIALVNMTCGHAVELKERLTQLGDGDDRYAGTDDRDLVFYKDLMECCRRYEDCLSLAATVNNILSPTFFVQFGVSGLVLCSTVYVISMNNPLDNPLKFFTVVIYLACIVAQLLPNCYMGSRLSDEFDGITSAIYESQWIDRNEKCKRAMRILVERSMRPTQIFAGGLFELSLPTFVRICKAAYSYFNLLRRLDSKMI